ncbi:MAG: S8 family serine peptidase, partial [Lysobacter sp.]
MPGLMSLGVVSTAWAQDHDRDVDPEPDATDSDDVDTDKTMAEDDYGDPKGERTDPADARDFEPDEVLAFDLSAEQIAQARTLGFSVREQLDLDGLGLKLHRLAVPTGLSVDSALTRLRAGDPHGDYERNSRYRLAGAQCVGVRCYGQQLVAPPHAALCESAPRIAVLDTAVDVQHPALRQAHIQTIRIGAGAGSPAAHGTAVAAVLVGASAQGFSGLLPQARLFAADVFDTHS